MKNPIVRLKELSSEINSHGIGEKFVFRTNGELSNSITQIAFGKFKPSDRCEFHLHETMDEYFYFFNGLGKYYIENEVYNVSQGVFVEIKSNQRHMLVAEGTEILEFIYWGVAVE
jgi:quercetin dioxygenase-like cupin family protein